jgi:hypothetical protein
VSAILFQKHLDFREFVLEQKAISRYCFLSTIGSLNYKAYWFMCQSSCFFKAVIFNPFILWNPFPDWDISRNPPVFELQKLTKLENNILDHIFFSFFVSSRQINYQQNFTVGLFNQYNITYYCVSISQCDRRSCFHERITLNLVQLTTVATGDLPQAPAYFCVWSMSHSMADWGGRQCLQWHFYTSCL